MLRINLSFNLAVHLPLRWIALLLYLTRVAKVQDFRSHEAAGS